MAPLRATAASDSTSLIYFSAGWRSIDSAPQNVVQLGAMYRCGSSWCADQEDFEGHRNLPREPVAARHEMQAPGGKKQGCIDEPLTTIRGSLALQQPATVTATETGMHWQIGEREYEWRRDASPAGGWLLESIKVRGALIRFAQPVGYAYEADLSTSPVRSLDELEGYFDGEIQHKDMTTGVLSDWLHKASSIDVSKFRSSATGSPVIGFVAPGRPEVERRFGRPTWVQHSMLLLAPLSSKLRYVLHEYGHDFNGNGCFDEPGHNKLLLPVRNQQRVQALLYIEYTPDPRDGVPMISIGRYSRRISR